MSVRKIISYLTVLLPEPFHFMDPLSRSSIRSLLSHVYHKLLLSRLALSTYRHVVILNPTFLPLFSLIQYHLLLRNNANVASHAFLLELPECKVRIRMNDIKGMPPLCSAWMMNHLQKRCPSIA